MASQNNNNSDTPNRNSRILEKSTPELAKYLEAHLEALQQSYAEKENEVPWKSIITPLRVLPQHINMREDGRLLEEVFIGHLRMLLHWVTDSETQRQQYENDFHDITEIFCSLCVSDNIHYDFVKQWLDKWLRLLEYTWKDFVPVAFEANLTGFKQMADMLGKIGNHSLQEKMVKILVTYSVQSENVGIDTLLKSTKYATLQDQFAAIKAVDDAKAIRRFLNALNMRIETSVVSILIHTVDFDGKNIQPYPSQAAWFDINYGTKDIEFTFTDETNKKMTVGNQNVEKIEIGLSLAFDNFIDLKIFLATPPSIENSIQIYHPNAITFVLHASTHWDFTEAMKDLFPEKTVVVLKEVSEQDEPMVIEGNLDIDDVGALDDCVINPTKANDEDDENTNSVPFEANTATQMLPKPIFDIPSFGKPSSQSPPSSPECKSQTLTVKAEVHPIPAEFEEVLEQQPAGVCTSQQLTEETLSNTNNQSKAKRKQSNTQPNFDEIISIPEDLVLPAKLTSENLPDILKKYKPEHESEGEVSEEPSSPPVTETKVRHLGMRTRGQKPKSGSYAESADVEMKDDDDNVFKLPTARPKRTYTKRTYTKRNTITKPLKTVKKEKSEPEQKRARKLYKSLVDSTSIKDENMAAEHPIDKMKTTAFQVSQVNICSNDFGRILQNARRINEEVNENSSKDPDDLFDKLRESPRYDHGLNANASFSYRKTMKTYTQTNRSVDGHHGSQMTESKVETTTIEATAYYENEKLFADISYHNKSQTDQIITVKSTSPLAKDVMCMANEIQSAIEHLSK